MDNCYIATLAISRDPLLTATVVYIPGKNFEIFDGACSSPEKILKILKDVCHVEDDVLKNCQRVLVPSTILDELVTQAGKAESVKEMDEYVMPVLNKFPDKEKYDLIKAAEGKKEVRIVDKAVQKPVDNQTKKQPKPQPQKAVQKPQAQQPKQPQQPRGPHPGTPIVIPLDPDRNSGMMKLKTTVGHVTAVCQVKDKTDSCIVLIGQTSKFLVSASYDKVCSAVYGS